MRRPRFKIQGQTAYYHCVSRVVNREFVLGPAEKEQFIRFMRIYEGLYGLRVVAYCVMSNHFHLLVEVPEKPADEELPSDEALITHVKKWLGEGKATVLAEELNRYRSQGNDEAAEALRERWFARMWDISRFMKVLKQRFTQWFNGRHNRRGTLWEDRFKSVLVEGKGQALKTIAAYIDLNPVRAKICEDPKEYRWCSYAEAVAGGKLAKEGYAFLNSFEVVSDGAVYEKDERGRKSGLEVIEAEDNEERLHRRGKKPQVLEKKDQSVLTSLEAYRCFLFGIPESAVLQEEERQREKSGGRVHIYRARISREKALEVLQDGGKLKRSDYLRCRVRYFCDGAAIGSKEFVEGVFKEAKNLFHEKRSSGARPLRGLETVPKPERLYNLRQLQKSVVS